MVERRDGHPSPRLGLVYLVPLAGRRAGVPDRDHFVLGAGHEREDALPYFGLQRLGFIEHLRTDSTAACWGEGPLGDGSTGSVTYTTLGQAGLDRERIEVFGGHRAAHIDNFRRAHLHQGNRRRRIRHWRQNLGYREELDAFLSAVATGAPMPIPLDHLLATSLATLRVVESLQRRQPVEVNLAALDSQHD